MTRISILIFLLWLNVLFCFSQSDPDYVALQNDLEDIHESKLINFHKAFTFFYNAKIDSAYFYCSRASEEILKKSEATNYLNLIFGVSSYDKGFYTLAKKKLKNISRNFKYQYLVDYNLGNIALNNKQYQEALAFYNAVLQSKKVKSGDRLKRIYHNLGVCYLHLEDYVASEKFLLKELEASQNTNDTLSIIYSTLDLANLYYVQHKDEVAISFYKEAYQLAVLLSDINAKKVTAQNLAVVEKNRNRYKESTLYYTEYVKWKDSLWNLDKISQLLEKDKQIALVTKNKQIAMQKLVTVKQKKHIQLFVSILIIIMLFLGLLSYMFRIKIKQNTLINFQNEQLEHLNTTKNYLLSVISHDLRTPINTIKVNHKKLSALLNDSLHEDAINLNKKSEAVAESTSGMLNNILNWALQQNGQLLFIPESHFLDLLINSILQNFRPLAEAKNISIVTLFEDVEKQVFLDKELFKIAFRNLIDNAIKYTPAGGSIKIKTKIKDAECILTIADSGKGMAEDVLKDINTYDTLNIEKIDRSKGLGLGLVLSKTLLVKNNGTFEIQNNSKKGITVTIKLPTKKIKNEVVTNFSA